MAERPILFSAPMVRAILDGRKTQTRRVLKDAPSGTCWHCDRDSTVSSGLSWVADGGAPRMPIRLPCAVGDTLYVREAWQAADFYDDQPPRDIPPGAYVSYLADGDVNDPTDEHEMDLIQQGDWGRKRVGMHMPRWASRIALTVTDVRVQRLQEIGEDDAKAEGVEPKSFWCEGAISLPKATYRDGFAFLWRNLNEVRGYGWDVNPWIVAMTFEKVTP